MIRAMPKTNKGNHQSERYVFPLRSNGAAEEAGNASVRQDKARISSARPGTTQPAVETKYTRAHPLKKHGTRSTNGNTPKPRTLHLDLWVKPIVKDELQRIAEKEGVSLSAAGAALLEQSLQNHVDMQYSALLEPIITSAIRKAMQGMSNRLAFLLARSAFSSEQTRAIVTNILGRQPGMSKQLLNGILSTTKRSAQGILTKRNPELEELIAQVKQWLDHEETDKPN
jgi:hypothetical protein